MALIISAELSQKFPQAEKLASCGTNDNGLWWLLPFLHFLRQRQNRHYSVTASCLKNTLPSYVNVESKLTKETLFLSPIAYNQNFLPSPCVISDNI